MNSSEAQQARDLAAALEAKAAEFDAAGDHAKAARFHERARLQREDARRLSA